MTTASPGLPATMNAAVLNVVGPPDTLLIQQVPVPVPSPDHVVIALEYAGVGSWDAAQRSGSWGKIEPGTILGADGSGTVAAVGPHVDRFKVGDRVYSYSYRNSTGGFYAQYVSVPVERVAPVPAEVTMTVAGAMPCVALTALSGLEALHLKNGQILLVFGASGGVGSMAVWLAHLEGAAVVGTARPDAQEYVRHLGAAHAIDSESPSLKTVIRRVAPENFDACLVTANGKSLPVFISHLKTKAPFAWPNGVESLPKFSGHPGVAFDGSMSRAAFDRLNALIGSRSVPLRTEVFSLRDVAEAHRRIERGHVIGKIVLRTNT
jgi:NADPH:quinone reductase